MTDTFPWADSNPVNYLLNKLYGGYVFTHVCHYGADPDSRSEFRIENMNFLKSVTAGELLVTSTFNQYQTIP